MVALDPCVRGLLADSSTGLGRIARSADGLARQKLNYHLRALEPTGFVRSVEERRWGG